MKACRPPIAACAPCRACRWRWLAARSSPSSGRTAQGKSTLLKLLAGQVATEGAIEFEGVSRCGGWRRIGSLGWACRWYRRGGGCSLGFPSRTICGWGAYLKRGRGAGFKPLDLVFSLFPRLQERLPQRAETLSGGEQQMLAIGRALMTGPKFLMLDEPSQGIMPRLVDDILAAVGRIRDLGVTVLLVEQRLVEALEIADRAYVLQTGRIVMSGLRWRKSQGMRRFGALIWGFEADSTSKKKTSWNHR